MANPTHQKQENKSMLLEAPRPRPSVLQTKNFMAITIKMLTDATTQELHRGRLVISNSEVFTVHLCGMLTKVTPTSTYTDYTFYDGTGSIEARIWPEALNFQHDLTPPRLKKYYMIVGEPRHETQGVAALYLLSARLITNHNDITHHFFTTIYEHLQLLQLAEKSSQQCTPSTTFSKETQLKEAILQFLSTTEMRENEEGASFRTILQTVHMDSNTGRSILNNLLEEGKVYNTIDYEHFKTTAD
ncbi:unnamed protein product [Urochloa decumbens]|uniref:Replication protein A C-terminal domain-containing protein n=1 Tax=Urochloa decumbens TaxID=240449 RepID=A0ABC9ARV8_9POAL